MGGLIGGICFVGMLVCMAVCAWHKSISMRRLKGWGAAALFLLVCTLGFSLSPFTWWSIVLGGTALVMFERVIDLLIRKITITGVDGMG